MIVLTTKEAKLFAAAMDLACEVSVRSGLDQNIPSVVAFNDALAAVGQVANLGKKLGREVPFKLSPELEQQLREFYRPKPIEGEEWKA